MQLFDLLSLSVERDRIISVVGSGGKTTLIYALARERFSQAGHINIAVTTTTHIMRPTDSDFFVSDSGDISTLDKMKNGKIIVAGSPAPDGKLSAASAQTFEWLARSSDLLLIEADGSRGLPIKLPAGHEPVIPPQTDRVIVVAGMAALGRPLADCCHRAKSAADLLGVPVTAAVTPEMIASLLLLGYGRYNPVAALAAFGLPPETAHHISRVRELLLTGGISKVAIL